VIDSVEVVQAQHSLASANDQYIRFGEEIPML
jgi:hypothetical protein